MSPRTPNLDPETETTLEDRRMELASLIAALSDPRAYPEAIEAVEVRQTHISIVLLAGRWVYKIKKPLRLGFLDYSTLERRRHFCAEELRINRRLASEIYVGVVAIAESAGVVRVEGPGEVIEWAVKMVRLPAEATLRASLEHGAVGPAVLGELAQRLAAFHARAERSPEVAASGRFAIVARNARENFSESADQVGTTISRAVFERLRTLTDQALDQLHDTIEARAARGVPCDGHGDLRLDHVYRLPRTGGAGTAAAATTELLIIDAIEFSARFRHADPVADIAFLVMDLEACGEHGLASGFADAYFDASGDVEGRALLPYYTAYRAAVRGKVEGLKAAEPEISADDRAGALQKARARWLLALSALEAKSRRPCLVLVAGLPGAGKSTLARGLAEVADFTLIRSDVVRKELAGVAGLTSSPHPFGQGIYSREWNDRTYAECLRRAGASVFDGRRVLVDASFGAEARRRLFLEAARRWGVPGMLLVCHVDEAVVEARLRARQHDVSDADWPIHRQAAAAWEPLGPETEARAGTIDTDGSPEAALARGLVVLRERGLAEEVTGG
jgi:aminoglycoside phosphotransferase family enzyme/predicted kinase